MKIFDLIVVGSGPIAISALSELVNISTNLKIAVISGVGEGTPSQCSRLHPKIDMVAYERNEPVGGVSLLKFDNFKRGNIFSTAAIGGLANYWGQQFLRYEKNDCWPKHLFESFGEYVDYCSDIEGLFNFSNDETSEILLNDVYGYTAKFPRLLTGTIGAPNTNLKAMRDLYSQILNQTNISTINGRVSSFRSLNNKVEIELQNGLKIEAKKVLLSAGVVGDLEITMRSWRDISTARFSDHSPAMLYFSDHFGFIKNKYAQNQSTNFNTLTIEKINSANVNLFSSVYRMSMAPLGLLIKALNFDSLFPKFYPPKLIDLVLPIQVWTPHGKIEYQINNNYKNVTVVENPIIDNELINFRKFLNCHGYVLGSSKTPPGHGFHYHSARVSPNGDQYMDLSNYINEMSGGKIICIDASIHASIGLRPPTLSMMAGAKKIVHHLYA
jgi:hypothetical protein